jgi:hypothetical protein
LGDSLEGWTYIYDDDDKDEENNNFWYIRKIHKQQTKKCKEVIK